MSLGIREHQRLNITHNKNNILRNRELNHINSPMKKCECGCGEMIHSINIIGKPARFKNHHNIRGSKSTGHWKRGGRFINTQGYIFIHKSEHPFATKQGYVREHRLVMEEYLGRYLDPSEAVHHINGIKTDNKIENLKLMTFSEHTINHLKENWEKGIFTHNQYGYYKR